MNKTNMKRAVSIAGAFLAGLATMWVMSIRSGVQESESSKDGQEKIKQVAPDGANAAFVWLPKLGGLGATVSQPYQVWVESQREGKEKRLVFEADKTDWILLRWHGAALLEICYSEARVHRFNNYFVSVERDNNFPEVREIEILLKRVQTQKDC